MLAERAIWQVKDWEDFALWTARANLVIVLIVISVLTIKSLRHKSLWKEISPYIRGFTSFWVVYLLFFAAYTIFAGTLPFNNWGVSLYGAGFWGALSGLYWCIWNVRDEPNKMKREFMREVRKIKEDVGNYTEREVSR